MECRIEDMRFTDSKRNEGDGLGEKKNRLVQRDLKKSYRKTGRGREGGVGGRGEKTSRGI